MKKFLSKFITAIILISSLGSYEALAFTDLNASDKNYEAINYLEQNNVIQGYQDGTFKPSQPVTRAEFTKILIKSNFSEDEISSCSDKSFPDVSESEWFYQYVCIAKKYGIIQGYQDGSFQPDKTINQVEALKIVGETENWELQSPVSEKPFNNVATTEWFAPYVTYAKTQGYLEENSANLLIFKSMTRANISELIYRTLTTTQSPEPLDSDNIVDDIEKVEVEPSVERTKQTPQETLNFTPVSYQNISKTKYSGIVLDEELPNTFYKNEVYTVKGKVSGNVYNVATIIISEKNGKNQRTFEGDLTNQHFEIPIYFSAQGNYEIGILQGNNGQYQSANISVLPNLPDNSGNEVLLNPASNLASNFKNDQTFVTFDSNPSTINKIYFEQGANQTYFISRQEDNKAYLDYRNFEGFQEGNVSYHIESAKLSSQKPLEISSNYTTSEDKSFYAVEHSFDDFFKDQISSNNVPDLKNDLSTISFSGSVLIDTEFTALIITPQGTVEEKDLSTTSQTSTYFSNKIIPSGGNFSFSYQPSQKGRYIIEINNKNGEASLNHPVYVGNTIPLIPDFFDLNEATLFSGEFNLDQLRTTLLSYINEARSNVGLNTIIMDPDLNDLAQAHSTDQVIRNFFGHINPDGDGPSERRIAAGIKTAVGENVALSPTLKYIHYGLMRSAAHRVNILNPSWTRVGLGIKQGENNLAGHLIVTQEFSTEELTQSDLTQMKNEAVSEINQKRQSLGLTTLTIDPSVEATSLYLNNKVINDGAVITSALFEEALQANNVIGPSSVVLRSASTWSSTLDSIINNENSIEESNWETIGFDIQLDFNGLIYTIFTLNNPS